MGVLHVHIYVDVLHQRIALIAIVSCQELLLFHRNRALVVMRDIRVHAKSFIEEFGDSILVLLVRVATKSISGFQAQRFTTTE